MIRFIKGYNPVKGTIVRNARFHLQKYWNDSDSEVEGDAISHSRYLVDEMRNREEEDDMNREKNQSLGYSYSSGW